MKKKLTKEQKKLHETARFPTKKSVEIMKFALSRGLSIYPFAQPSGKVKLFKQFGENFLELSSKIYTQDEHDDIMEMLYDINQGYLAYYNKFK